MQKKQFVKYSVIIPHHNLPILLQRCLDSIPIRTDIQVIVVDDNSSSAIVDFEDFPGKDRENVELFFDKVGGGAGHARNLGLSKARGSWLLFADSDDFFTQRAFDELDQYADSNVDIVLFKIKSVFSETLKPADREGSSFNNYVDAYQRGKIEKMLMPFFNQAPWAKMINAKVIRENNIQFDNIICAEDIMFSTKIACNVNNVVISDFPLYVVTYREGSLTATSRIDRKKFLSRIDALIRRNIYIKRAGYQQSFLSHCLFDSMKIDIVTFYECLMLLLKNKMLTAGLWDFILFEYYTKIRKKEYYII